MEKTFVRNKQILEIDIEWGVGAYNSAVSWEGGILYKLTSHYLFRIVFRAQNIFYLVALNYSTD